MSNFADKVEKQPLDLDKLRETFRMCGRLSHNGSTERLIAECEESRKRIAEQDAAISRLRAENHDLHGECGHLQADKAELVADVERLTAALAPLRLANPDDAKLATTVRSANDHVACSVCGWLAAVRSDGSWRCNACGFSRPAEQGTRSAEDVQREYLRERGWFRSTVAVEEEWWVDPEMRTYSAHTLAEAVGVQRVRETLLREGIVTNG